MFNINPVIFFLKLGPGLLMLIFGISQVRNSEGWFDEYVPKWFRKILPMHLVMTVHAVVNIILGVWLIVGIHLVLASWLGFVWMLSILPFAFYKSWKTGMRDLVTTLTLLALAAYLIK